MVSVSQSINNAFDDTVVKWLKLIIESVPEDYKLYLALGIAIIAITIYAIFIWKFYRFIAKRDILDLNLSQYNKTDSPAFFKFIALLLYVLEYIIILPILTFFWFFVMAVLFFLLAKELPIWHILLVSGSIIGAIRITAYYNEDLSKDIAKIFPFTILAIALVNPNFFNFSGTIGKISLIGDLMGDVLIFLIVLIILEFVLRMLSFLSPEETN